MECDQCGAPRPRMGPCPECGAPPPRFSARGGSGGSSGRGRSQPGRGSSGSQRTAGANLGGGGGGLLNRGSGARRRGMGSDDGWDDEEYSVPAPSRAGGRYSSGEYGGVDPSRALVPQYDEVMPPAAEGSLMAGLPGFPQTDEEERSIGLRRPAYIPATEPKRKRKLSSGRVVSGMLSLLLVTVGVCGALGFLGQQQIVKLLPGPLKDVVAQPTVDLSQVSATPVSTPGPSSKIVTSVVTAKGKDKDGNPIDVTSYFNVNSTVYAIVNIVGASQSTTNTLTCRWFLNGIDFKLKDGTTAPITPSKTSSYRGYCALPYYQTGIGMVKVYWNKPSSDSGDAANDKYLAQTIKFAVLSKLPGTTTPASGTAKPGGPTPSPTKKAFGAALPVAWRIESGAS